jgi:hypothetical protein
MKQFIRQVMAEQRLDERNVPETARPYGPRRSIGAIA